MVHLSQLILGKTGCVSYIILCKKEGIGAIVDPFIGFEEDIEKELLNLNQPNVKYVIDTHTHGDRRSSSPHFAKKYNTAGIVKSSKTGYKGKIIATRDGDVLEMGESKIKVLFTPGHTYDHNCYLVDNYLLSGDSLFIGDVGRVDLGFNVTKENIKERSNLMFDCLRRLERLDSSTKICPNHVGEAHAISSEDTFSTIGKELETNEALQIKDRDEFYTYMTEGWPPKPEGYLEIIKYNLNG
jgi:glyoxylase-like metal-dependent hydrolase (beta-lactamase superfamily II)